MNNKKSPEVDIVSMIFFLLLIKFLQITYASNNKCDNVEAISAKINLDILFTIIPIYIIPEIKLNVG